MTDRGRGERRRRRPPTATSGDGTTSRGRRSERARAWATRLVDGYDLVIFDLDGVIYLIDRPIPGAAEAVARLRAGGTAVAYATNNASRRASEVADLLTGMGVPAAAGRGAHLGRRLAPSCCATGCPAGAPVLVVGAEALRAEVRAVGLSPVAEAEDEAGRGGAGVRPAGRLGRPGRGGA